jgi:hypothetical protein
MPNLIERGIWYEETRKRYRVRLYKKGEVIHLSYHAKYEQALLALNKARYSPKQANTLTDIIKQLDSLHNRIK